MHITTATYLHSHHSPNSQVARVTFQVEEIFKFAEWQFVMIEGQIGDKKIKKPYSIASTSLQMQESKQISFVVKKASEDGMSHYLTQDITSGDQITVKGPVWHYTDSHAHPNYLFIATGSGLSPNVWLFQHLVYEHWSFNQIVNVFGEKTLADIVPEIETLFAQHGQQNIINFFHLSREEKFPPFIKGGAEGGGIWKPWRIQSSLPEAIELLGTQTSCFICGLPAMVDDARHILQELWVESEDITFEKY